MASQFKLTLFVTPACSGTALSDLYRALSVIAYNAYELSLINVLEQPEAAASAKIVDTPALIYHSPDGPVLIQNVGDTALIRTTLGLVEI